MNYNDEMAAVSAVPYKKSISVINYRHYSKVMEYLVASIRHGFLAEILEYDNYFRPTVSCPGLIRYLDVVNADRIIDTRWISITISIRNDADLITD